MAKVKIQDLKPEARELDEMEMKKLFGGQVLYFSKTPLPLNAKGNDFAIEEIVLTVERIDPL
jgi:TfoX/Sxy family transcriptional regulator of competence genes